MSDPDSQPTTRRRRASRKRPTHEARLTEALPQAIEKLIELASGLESVTLTTDGTTLYSQPPNRMAAEYLVNRVLGRPTTSSAEAANGGAGIDFAAIQRERNELKEVTPDELNRIYAKAIGSDQ